MNIKKLFAALAGVSLFAQTVVPSAGVFGAEYSQELQDAYNWAYSKSITTMSPIDNANMYGAITRAELAKMLANWAKDGGATPDTSKSCTFTDTASVGGDLAVAIVESCQLGLMGQGITEFRPYATISRAEFGTALSRALWGDKYEGGNPYYVNHLNALQAAGIMKQIANAESTKEVRGYVMLMLMRADEGAAEKTDCNDPVVKAACLLDSESCPAACKEESKDSDTVVKAGDLVVSADAAANRKILASGTSDLDTITFKSSENVDINKITLERYGYSESDQVVEVWLEDQDGNVIADAKGLTKDKVTLSIKKGYRAVDGSFDATLVVTTSGAAGTMWFKVTDVDSTAANLNLKDYSANLYDVVAYSSKTVYVEIKGTTKDYNYEEGKSYEVARLKVKAGANAIIVKGFTLTNASGLDMAEFLDKLTVTADGKDVNWLKYNVNKDDELVISFNDIDIDMNKNATFVISASFKDFDDYGETVAYYVAETADVNAVETKNWTRVDLDLTKAGKADAKAHKFAGWKIKIANKKLGNVDAAQGSEDIVIAEWDITISEGVNKMSFELTAANTGVESLKFVINGDEYEWKRSESGANVTFSFKNVEITKSGKAQFLVGIYDRDSVAGSFTFSAFNKNAFSGAKYSEANEPVQTADVAGSISFSKVTIQASKWALENNLTKDVEFLTNSTTRKTVFDGTYTAKKGDVKLNSFYIAGTDRANGLSDEVTFYVSVDGEEVGDTTAYGSGNKENFSEVLVEAGKSVKVKVEAEVEAYTSWLNFNDLTLVLAGEDNNGNDAGEASDSLVTFKTKESGSTKVEAGTSKNTVLLKGKNQEVASFVVKPSNSTDDDLILDELVIDFTWATVTANGIRVKVGGTEYDADSTYAGTGIKYEPSEEIPTDGLKVEVILKNEYTGAIDMTLISVNGKSATRKFSKRYEEALIKIASQEDLGGSTKFTLAVEEAESDDVVSNLKLYVGSAVVYTGTSEISDGETIEVSNTHSNGNVQMIDKIEYTINNSTTGTVIEKSAFEDYFKVGNSYAKIFASK